MKTPGEAEAFSLTEVTLALGIAAFSLLSIFALLPISLQSNRNASEQTAAPKILGAVAADIRSTPAAATSSPLFGISIPAATSSSSSTLFFTAEGEQSSSLNSDSRFRLVVTFFPNSNAPEGAIFGSMRLSWPAAADPVNAAGAVESFVALTRL